jgi:hypothetical protein
MLKGPPRNFILGVMLARYLNIILSYFRLNSIDFQKMQFFAIRKRHQAAGFYSLERSRGATKVIFRKSVFFSIQTYYFG